MLLLSTTDTDFCPSTKIRPIADLGSGPERHVYEGQTETDEQIDSALPVVRRSRSRTRFAIVVP
jgi:hypothetical protein